MPKKPVTPPNAEFVGRVVGDAKNPPETRMLSGWFGDAAEEGYRRLYTDAELSAYVDIPTDAILYTEPIRDVQPSGGVFVWVKRDAALKPGGSAASRAARFLQGQVQQDFSSPEKAGLRCVTEVPCGEPTGFTGQCTKQPDVGGAWPCITAIPLCAAEPTGFTGKCTDLPWPNPTRYLGCTYLHCPTKDLTHIPHICHIVATGLPGCPVVDPRGGGTDPAAKASAAEGKEGGGAADRAAAPSTSIPGCGYTQTWGLCETHLLGCGFTKQGGQQCPTQLPGCGWTQQWGLCQQTQPPKCNVSVDIPCITQDLACGVTRNPACLANAGGGRFAAFQAAAAGPGLPIPSPFPCGVSLAVVCPTLQECQTPPPTALPICTQIPGAVCPSVPATICTQTGPQCPTACGPDCQTQQHNCTQLGEICLTRPVECTQFGPKCPTPGAVCPTFPPGCPNTDVQIDCTFGCTHAGVGCPSNPVCPIDTNQPQCFPDKAAARAFAAAGPIGPTAYYGCTQFGPQCFTYPNGDCTFFGCPPFTRTFQCGGGGPSAVDACPTRLCGGGQQFFGAAARPAQDLGAVGTFFSLFEVRCVAPDTFFDVQCQPGPPTSPPQCPHTAQAECPPPQPPTHRFHICTLEPGCGQIGTEFGPQCPTPACPQPQTHRLHVCQPWGPPLGVGTVFSPQCQQAGPQIAPLTIPLLCQAPTPATRCFICPPPHRSLLPWLCPAPSPYCPPYTQTFHCGGGPSAVDACPTRICGGGGFGGDPFAGGGGQRFFGAAAKPSPYQCTGFCFNPTPHTCVCG